MFQEDVQLMGNLKDGMLVGYHAKFLEKDRNDVFKLFESSIVYNSDEDSKIKIFGKEHVIPRKQVAFGDKGITYSFSGNTVNALDWNTDNELCKTIRFIRDKVAKRFNFNPNFVLVNRYENGNQYIGYHSDDEKDLIQDAPIVGVSFGAEREILFKNKATGKVKSLLLKHGSAFCMYCPTNANYMHSIPARKGVGGPRISLTFREMKK